MESQVEKMYENAGIKKKEKGYCDCDYMNCPNPDIEPCGKECCYWVDKGIDYPPFTPGKQLELIKWLGKFNLRIEQPDYAKDYYFIETHTGIYSKFLPIFEEALAGLINNLWSRLTEEEKQQVKRILE